MFINLVKSNSLMFFALFWAAILLAYSTTSILTSIFKINELRRKAVALSEKNEILSLQVEQSLSEIISSSSITQVEEEKVEKANQVLKRLNELKLKVLKMKQQREQDEKEGKFIHDKHHHDEKKRHRQQEEQQQQVDANEENNKNNIKKQDPPSTFAALGSHLLEGQDQQMILEQKWNY